MTTFTNRKTAREAVATGLSTALVDGTAVAKVVYNYIPNNISGLGAPAITVSSFSWSPQFNGSAHVNSMDLLVTAWVMRLNKEQDKDYSADSEDELDNVSREIIEYFETWNNGFIFRPSETDYPIVDGWQWRTETHFIHIDHYEGE